LRVSRFSWPGVATTLRTPPPVKPRQSPFEQKYESTKQLQPSQSPTPIVDRSDLRQFALTLAAQPMDNENAQSGEREFLVGTWIALAIVADTLAARSDCAASTNSDHKRGIDPELGKGACVQSGPP
jgi:hypothetical protein